MIESSNTSKLEQTKLTLPDTAFGNAIASLFEQVNDALSFRFPINIYIAGGAAMHMYLGNVRISGDVDAQISRVVIPSDLSASYVDQSGKVAFVKIDAGFNDTTGPLSPDYQEDANPLSMNKEYSMMNFFVLQPVDLAVSKLGRFASHDITDILSLHMQGLFTTQEFQQRSEDAFDYYASLSSNTINHRNLAVSIMEEIDKGNVLLIENQFNKSSSGNLNVNDSVYSYDWTKHQGDNSKLLLIPRFKVAINQSSAPDFSSYAIDLPEGERTLKVLRDAEDFSIGIFSGHRYFVRQSLGSKEGYLVKAIKKDGSLTVKPILENSFKKDRYIV